MGSYSIIVLMSGAIHDAMILQIWQNTVARNFGHRASFPNSEVFLCLETLLLEKLSVPVFFDFFWMLVK